MPTAPRLVDNITPTRDTPDRLSTRHGYKTEAERRRALTLYATTTLTYAQAEDMIAAEPGGRPVCGMRHDSKTIFCQACRYDRGSEANRLATEAAYAAALVQVRRLNERLATVTTFTVCPLPRSDPRFNAFAVEVQWRGEGLWAVAHGGFHLSDTKRWDRYGPASKMTVQWRARHRFDLDTALRLAEEISPSIVWNGITAAQAAHADGAAAG